VNEVRDPSGTEMIDQIKVILPHIVDLRDFKIYKAMLVLGGTALFVQKPAVPFFLLHDNKELFESELSNCTRTMDAHTVHANRIKANVECNHRTVLLVFPDGMTCMAMPGDASKKKNKKGDNKLKLTLRTITKKFQSGKNPETTQTYVPGHWLVRIHDENRRLLKAEEEEEDDDDIESAFSGMKVWIASVPTVHIS